MGDFLRVNHIEALIQNYHILRDVTFDVTRGGVTVLLGRNGAGKTTTLRSIMGLNQVRQGSTTFKGEDISNLSPHKIANKGIGFVPEDQGIFGELTVGENIRVAMKNENQETAIRMEWVLDLFSDLKKFWTKPGGQLSGGQKQMLAIARSYLNANDLLLIDEPSKGLAPIVVEKVMESVQQMKEETTILLVEQNFMMASEIADQFYIIDDGQTVYNGAMEELKDDKVLLKKYLGIS